MIARWLSMIAEIIGFAGAGAALAFLGWCLVAWEIEEQRDPAPPKPQMPVARPVNFPGNAHQRRIARRKFERANKLGNA
jgi:hypothetical protein